MNISMTSMFIPVVNKERLRQVVKLLMNRSVTGQGTKTNLETYVHTVLPLHKLLLHTGRERETGSCRQVVDESQVAGQGTKTQGASMHELADRTGDMLAMDRSWRRRTSRGLQDSCSDAILLS